MVASAMVVFASIAVFATLYSAANRHTLVLIVTTTIEQGQRITGSDLGEASVTISGGVTPIPVSDASELAGKRASVTIPAGSLLTIGDVTGAPAIAAGDAVVGISLKNGQLPASGVKVGDRVMIVQTDSPGTPLASASGTSDSSEATTGVLVPEATVVDVEVPSTNASSDASLLVSVEVSSTLVADVATAAAADQVSVVLLPDGTEGQGSTTGGPSSVPETSLQSGSVP